MAKYKVYRGTAIRVFEAMGVTAAKDWNRRRMMTKIKGLPEQVDPDYALEDEELDKVLKAMVSAIDSEEGVEVTPEPITGDGGGGTKDDVDNKGETGGKDEEKGSKDTKEAGKTGKEDAPAASANGRPKGVRDAMSRGYVCGVVLKEFGQEPGVTDEMVARADELFGKDNPSESRAWLASSWHVINGYLNPEKHRREEAKEEEGAAAE